MFRQFDDFGSAVMLSGEQNLAAKIESENVFFARPIFVFCGHQFSL